MSLNMDGSPRRVRCVLRRTVESAQTTVKEAAANYGVDLRELKDVLLRALMPYREAHQAVCNALRARWPEQLRV